MLILYILCTAVICLVAYAFVWICSGTFMSLFSKKFQVEDEVDDFSNDNDNNTVQRGQHHNDAFMT